MKLSNDAELGLVLNRMLNEISRSSALCSIALSRVYMQSSGKVEVKEGSGFRAAGSKGLGFNGFQVVGGFRGDIFYRCSPVACRLW